MMDIYPSSLSRKRYYFSKAIILSRDMYTNRKFKFSQDEFKDLAQKLTIEQICRVHEFQYGIPISVACVRYWCKKWNIQYPSEYSLGYLSFL